MNELTNINQRPAYLAKVDAATMADEFLGGISGGLALPAVSVRGKEFRLRYQGQEVNIRQRELDVLIVASRPDVSKRWYAQGYESGETEAPTCSSPDGVTPDVPEPVAASCAVCPKNVWGSGPNGRGKACKDYKRLVVVPLIDGKMNAQAAVLDVSATALKSPKDHKGPEQFLREYMTALSRHGLPPQGVVTRLAFTEAEYPQLHFAFARHATEQEHAHAMGLREHPDTRSVLEDGQHEEAGGITPTELPLAPPAEAPQAVPEKPADTPLSAPVFMWDDSAEQGAKVTTKEELDAWTQRGAEEISEKMYARLTGESATPAAASSPETAAPAATAEPAPQPEPTAEITGEEDEEGIFAEIKELLGGSQ